MFPLKRAIAATLALLLLPTGSTADTSADPAVAEKGTPGAEAFVWAFKFASAIEADPKDRSLAESSVALNVAMAGDLDAAVKLADDVTGWRQGTTYADLAVMLAKEGRAEEARRLVARAHEVRETIQGWQNGRIRSHIAHAGALLGDVDRARETGAALAKADIQYVGKSVANVASGHGMRGDFDEALRALATLEDEGDYEIAWWRTYGYLELSELSTLTDEQRRAALDLAVGSAETIPGWKRGEALVLIANRFVETGDVEAARAALAPADEAFAVLTPKAAVFGPILCDLARARVRAGEPERVPPILERVRASIGEAMTIDRPQIYAEIGSVYFVLGDTKRAHEFFHSALRNAEGLVNARPRALAVVAICGTMGRVGAELDDLERSYLQKLYSGLREPW